MLVFDVTDPRENAVKLWRTVVHRGSFAFADKFQMTIGTFSPSATKSLIILRLAVNFDDMFLEGVEIMQFSMAALPFALIDAV